jgi:WD40 repeat protein
VSADADPRTPPTREQAIGGGRYSVDAHGAMAVQVGDRNIQINYYSQRTWTDGITAPPIANDSGLIDSPFRGLSAFEERDAAFFFGRETAARQVLERMSRQLKGAGLLLVSGVSGAGKSSLLRAGVLPHIRRAGLASAPGSALWPCLLFTPGPAPLDELAARVASLAGADVGAVRRGLDIDPEGFALTVHQAALTEPSRPARPLESPSSDQQRRLLLVIDQFEQLFTQCSDEEQRRAFITALHAAATVGHGPSRAPATLVVLGVRADFEARCADYPQLADVVQDRYLVTSMTERQLRMAIAEPAKKAGSRVEDDLVNVLLREMSTRPPEPSSAVSHTGGISGAGVLPLLSHALDQAWRSRTGGVLTLADYERTGGIEGAVARSAQRTYDSLSPAQQAAARQAFIRLTATSSDGVDAAKRVAITDLTGGKSTAEVSDVEVVLEAFTAERLVTRAAGTVEISHEVLLTAWPLLRDNWLAENHADRIVRTRLQNVAADWERDSRDPSYLYSGNLLEAATETAARIGTDPVRHPPLSQTEQSFLQASDHAHHRTVRRRQRFVAFLMVLVIGLASATVYAVRDSQEARQQRDIAVSGQLSDDSETLSDTDPVISKLESLAAWHIHPSDDARYAMLSAAASPGIGVAALPRDNGSSNLVDSVAFSPNGKILATGSFDGTVRLWNTATREQIGRPLTGPHPRLPNDSGVPNQVESVAFSPNGEILAAGSEDGGVWLWNVATHQQIGSPLPVNTRKLEIIESVAFSPNGTILAAGNFTGTVRLWNVATRQPIGNPLPVDTSTRLYHAVNSVAFSPDGMILATGSDDDTVRLWNLATHQQIGVPFAGSTGSVSSVAFRPDGAILAAGSDDGTARVWDVATHRQIGDPLTGSGEAIASLAFSPNGQVLVTGGDDHTVRLWDVANHQQLGPPLTGHTGIVFSVAFSSDGNTLASGSADGTVRFWDVAGATGIATLTDRTGSVLSAAFSPDSKTLATGTYDYIVWLWDLATRRPIAIRLDRHTGLVDSVAFSPDGKVLATGSSDGRVRLWDVATRRQIGNPLVVDTSTAYFSHAVNSVAFSPDGKILATASGDGMVRLWDVTTHRQIGNALVGFGFGASVESVVFSPDGNLLANADIVGMVHVWNVATHKQVEDLTGGNAETVAFSPDGRTLATGGTDNTVRLWDLATHQQIGDPLTGSTGWVTSVAFSPDGKTLATGSRDDTVRLWDVATRQQIGDPLAGFTRWVTSVAFSPDGKTLAGGNNDGTVRLWDVGYLMNTLPVLCASAGRSFTRTEWAQYVPELAYQNVCP